jgi:hypothetical protein
MAIAVTQLSPVGPEVWGRRRVALLRIAFSSTYATGGEAFDPKTYGVPDPEVVLFGASDAVTTSLVFHYDRANKKIMAFESGAANAALAEKTNSEAYPTDAEVVALVIGK